jgi:hypothetical protein
MSNNFSISRLKLKELLPKLLLLSFSSIGIILLQYSVIVKKTGERNLLSYQTEDKNEAIQLSFVNKTPSIGFANIMSSWLYLKFIQYFGDTEARNKTGYALTNDYFTEIANRDPRFMDAFFRLDTAMSLFAASPQRSVELLKKVLESSPPKFITQIPPYYLWRAKGNNELLFMGDAKAAQKSYANSIISANAYNDEDSNRIATISRDSIKFLENNPDSKLARIGAWVSILSNHPDKKTVERVTQEIEKLGGKVTVNQGGAITVQVPKEYRR